MTKLLYVDLSGLGLWDDRFKTLLESAASPSTRIAVRHLEVTEGPLGTGLPERPEFYYASLLKEIGQAQRDGFDAAMLGCASEPGLRDAANASRIPVIGPFGAALHIGGLMGRRIGIMCPAVNGHRDRPLAWHEQSLRMYGIAESLVTFRLVEIRKPAASFVAECLLSNDLDELRRVTMVRYRESIEEAGVEQARRAVEEDRAEALFFACTLWGGLLDPVGDAVDVPVLDPVITLLKATEAAAEARCFTRPSRRAVPEEEVRR